MLDSFVELLVNFGELVLILLASGLLVGLGYLLEEIFFKKSCDKK